MAKLLEFKPPFRSHISKLTYDPDTQMFRMFANGYSYTHAGVPASIFATMTRQPSPGSYYHTVIKRHYKLVGKTTPQDKTAPKD